MVVIALWCTDSHSASASSLDNNLLQIFVPPVHAEIMWWLILHDTHADFHIYNNFYPKSNEDVDTLGNKFSMLPTLIDIIAFMNTCTHLVGLLLYATL